MHPTVYNLEDQARMSAARNYHAWIRRMVAPALGRRVLEAGAGIGNFTRFLLDREAVIAVDSEPACIEELKRRFPGARNLDAVVSDISAPEFRGLSRFHPDSCVCLNVLEHIRDDRAALENMAAVIPPRGAIALLLPAFQSLYGPIDRNLGHYRRYTRKSIARLAKECGLEVGRLRYSNAAGFAGWWINARVLKRQSQSEAQIAAFDWIAPALEALERAIPPPFGLSTLALLRKP